MTSARVVFYSAASPVTRWVCTTVTSQRNIRNGNGIGFWLAFVYLPPPLNVPTAAVVAE